MELVNCRDATTELPERALSLLLRFRWHRSNRRGPSLPVQCFAAPGRFPDGVVARIASAPESCRQSLPLPLTTSSSAPCQNRSGLLLPHHVLLPRPFVPNKLHYSRAQKYLPSRDAVPARMKASPPHTCVARCAQESGRCS